MCNYMRNLTFEMFPKVVCYWYTSPCYHPYSSYKIVYSAVYNNQECTSNGEHNRSVHFLSFNFSQLVSFTTTDSKKNPKQTNIHLKPAICLIKLSTSKQSQFLISQDSQCELKVQLCLCLSRFTEWTRYPVGDMLHVQERYATHMFTRTQMKVSACQSVRCNETYVQSWVWKQSCVRFLKTAEWSFAAEAKCCRLTCSNMFSSCVINAVSLFTLTSFTPSRRYLSDLMSRSAGTQVWSLLQNTQWKKDRELIITMCVCTSVCHRASSPADVMHRSICGQLWSTEPNTYFILFLQCFGRFCLFEWECVV